MLGKDDQQKESDLREKRKTRLPEMPSPRVRIFHFQDGGDVTNLASEMQKQSNAPVPCQKLPTKVSKSRAMPPYPYVPGINPLGWPLISA